jgi:hypothetical protein
LARGHDGRARGVLQALAHILLAAFTPQRERGSADRARYV